MYNRKQNVIKSAHQLFIEKGVQATSIQDILDYSGISKGTFYNYFSSKNELIIGIYKTIYKELQKNKNDLLIGQDPANIEIFIKQLELQLITNRKNKLITIYEEVMHSNDPVIKKFIQNSRLSSLRWYYNRFIDIFGEEKKPYLLDCAIMFQGMLQHNLQYNRMAHETGEKISQVARYSVRRLIGMVDEVSNTGDQLLDPELMEQWLPTCLRTDGGFKDQLLYITGTCRKAVTKHLVTEEEQEKYIELVEFIKEELLHSSSPRKYIIESTLTSLKAYSFWEKELHELERLIDTYLAEKEKTK